MNLSEATRRTIEHYQETGNFYLLDYDAAAGEVLDGGFKGNRTRFANHSCDPNCHMQKWMLCGTGEQLQAEFEVGLFASRDLAAGEELTYDYGWSMFVPRSMTGEITHKGTPIACHCGSANCSGVLGGKKVAKPRDEKPDPKKKKKKKAHKKRTPADKGPAASASAGAAAAAGGAADGSSAVAQPAPGPGEAAQGAPGDVEMAAGETEAVSEDESDSDGAPNSEAEILEALGGIKHAAAVEGAAAAGGEQAGAGAGAAAPSAAAAAAAVAKLNDSSLAGIVSARRSAGRPPAAARKAAAMRAAQGQGLLPTKDGADYLMEPASSSSRASSSAPADSERVRDSSQATSVPSQSGGSQQGTKTAAPQQQPQQPQPQLKRPLSAAVDDKEQAESPARRPRRSRV